MTRHQATTRTDPEKSTEDEPTATPAGRREAVELLGDSRILRLATEHSPVLCVVVDTEEEFDWFEPFDRKATSVSAVSELPRAQRIFDDFGIRPTYAVDYAVVSQPGSVGVLREIHDSGRAEIATHQHPWVCPPEEEEPSELCSYPGNLPAHLEREKLLSLTHAIESAFGTRPSVYKAGRHGIGPNTLQILEEAGYQVDMSARPAYDFGAQSGPDFSAFPSEPYYWGPSRRIVGIPETGAFVGFAGESARPLYRLATKSALRWARLPGILSRVGAVERMLLSPEGFEASDLRRLTRWLFDRGVRTFVFCFHSPSLKPGCTPYVKTEAEREDLLARCRDYFEFFLGEFGGMAMTPIELKRHLVDRAEVLSPLKVLGISPLDKDATASLVEDGRVLFAAGEERFSRVKHHAGFPKRAIRAALEATGTSPEEIDAVGYPFLDWRSEARLIQECFADEEEFLRTFSPPPLAPMLAAAEGRVPKRSDPIFGLGHPGERMTKSAWKRFAYRVLGSVPAVSRRVARNRAADWRRRATEEHRKWNAELDAELAELGLLDKLERCEHHLSHAVGAYHASGFDRALVVTLDGYGSGLAGSVSLGEGGKLERKKNLRFPHSLGTFYEMVTSSLGFHPDRHAGKVVGLAAYGDPEVLIDVLLSRCDATGGDLRMLENLNVFFSRHLSTRFPKVDLAAAWQRFLEIVASDLIRHWVRETGCSTVALAGGVAANVKMNQRILEVEGVERVFVYPNMGDGGCGTGIAHELCRRAGTSRGGEPLETAYHGPEFDDASIRSVLEARGLGFQQPGDLAAEVARRIEAGEVVARFDGRMEYGPRALGNRSILYHAREPDVNQWLNQRLGRTEFMPFAPVTLWEHRHRCYENLSGAEHAAQFMTITFDCTPWMRENCPAAVHVDGTARPQLIRREQNPGYYAILSEYEKLTGVPCLINTSFNMHEEPIVCTPEDAVRAFLQGHLDALVIGSYLVPNPDRTGASGERGEAREAPARSSHLALDSR